MKQYKVGIIGLFAYGTDDCGGGVIKTRNYESILKEKYGSDQIITLDRADDSSSFVWIKKVIYICANSDVVIVMFSTKKMITLLLPVLVLLKSCLHFKLLYPVLGGWIADFLNEHRIMRALFKNIDEIYVETHSMKREISKILDNVVYMPNFSIRRPIKKVNEYNSSEYSFCIYSRIVKEKGIEIAINAIRKVNEIYGKDICKLYIYGKVYDSYKEEFERLINDNTHVVIYGGLLGNQALNVISKHYIMLFPTYYEGEGFPGTLVEAFMAGIPVIASDWKYNSEIIEEGKTGYLFDLKEDDSLVNIICKAICLPEIVNKMRFNCLQESKKYIPDSVMQPIYRWIH